MILFKQNKSLNVIGNYFWDTFNDDEITLQLPRKRFKRYYSSSKNHS